MTGDAGRPAGAASRLAAAIRREGVAEVAAFALRTLRRRGPLQALKLALAGREAREAAADEDLARGRVDEAPVRTPDLDVEGAMTAAAWARWAARFAPAAADETAADMDIVLVIDGEDQAPEAAARTRAAFARLFPTPSAPEARGGRWTLHLKPGDAPLPGFVAALAQAAEAGAAVVTFDMIRRDGDRVFPLLAPGANPTLLAGVDHVFGRFALLDEAERAASGAAREKALAWMEAVGASDARRRWRHLGRPLLDAAIAGEEVERARAGALLAGRRPPPAPREAASVVICTRDKGHLTRQLVRQLLQRDPREVAEVVVVANGTANPYALATLEDLAGEARVRVMRRDEPFNFSRLANAGAAATRGVGPLLFLNDDIAPVTHDWVARLLARLQAPEVGAVGALLLYPDERVQHAGMHLREDALAGHGLRHARLPADDYLFTAVAAREVTSLTGAVLMVRRSAFEALDGFDEALATVLQDVDLCLKLGEAGLACVFEPGAVLIHMESTSIRAMARDVSFHRIQRLERTLFRERWGGRLAHDPLFPAALDPTDETLRSLRRDVSLSRRGL